jgi:hypothetical protein
MEWFKLFDEKHIFMENNAHLYILLILALHLTNGIVKFVNPSVCSPILAEKKAKPTYLQGVPANGQLWNPYKMSRPTDLAEEMVLT